MAGTGQGDDATWGPQQVRASQQAAVPAPSTAGVVTPAAAAYTVADQTALADAVLSLAATVNALRDRLQKAGIIAS